MKKILFFLSFCLLTTLGTHAFAQPRADIEEQVKERLPPLVVEKEKNKVFWNSYYEYSWVKQDTRKGKWKLLTETLAYVTSHPLTPYIEFNAWDRFGDNDYTTNIGSLYRAKDNSGYGRAEIGFGSDIDYVYRFQSRLEYGHRLAKTFYGELGYRYLNYSDNDVYIFYPGCTYYFADNYISLFYNVSITEGRGTAQWGTLKGYFKITERLGLSSGAAVGQRLYDINPVSAQDQYGYIFFASLDMKMTDNISMRLGGSYSKESPDFFKRSIDAAITVKF